MMTRFSKLTLLSLLFASITAVSVHAAEPFRTSSLSSYQVQSLPVTEKPESALLGINDSLEIIYPTDNAYLLGIEIEIRIPKIIASYRDSEVFYLYENVVSADDGSPYDFVGDERYRNILPSRLSCVYRIPLDGKNFSDRSPYAQELPLTLRSDTDRIVLRTQLAMKGVPDEYLDSQFEVTVIPVIADLGSLSLTLLYPDGTDLTAMPLPLCYIDDAIADISEPVYLKTGVHHLSVLSEQYRNEFRTFTIDKATESSLQVVLQPVTTDITVQAPSGAEILLDGEPVESHRVIPVESGVHMVTCRYADYEITKSITVITGKSYVVTLSVDVTVSEQEYP